MTLTVIRVFNLFVSDTFQKTKQNKKEQKQNKTKQKTQNKTKTQTNKNKNQNKNKTVHRVFYQEKIVTNSISGRTFPTNPHNKSQSPAVTGPPFSQSRSVKIG